jgi:hypothetical protein
MPNHVIPPYRTEDPRPAWQPALQERILEKVTRRKDFFMSGMSLSPFPSNNPSTL